MPIHHPFASLTCPPPGSHPFPSQADVPPPMELIAQVPPIAIHADRVSCKSKGACMDLYGERAGLGAPNTYYQLNSTTPENPVKCKYCGLRFYGVH
jgi:NADH dehydrogenase (ubiquinone) Fe-S protein 6